MSSAVYIVSHLHEGYCQMKAIIIQHLKDVDYFRHLEQLSYSVIHQCHCILYISKLGAEYLCTTNTLLFWESYRGSGNIKKQKETCSNPVCPIIRWWLWYMIMIVTCKLPSRYFRLGQVLIVLHIHSSFVLWKVFSYLALLHSYQLAENWLVTSNTTVKPQPL